MCLTLCQIYSISICFFWVSFLCNLFCHFHSLEPQENGSWSSMKPNQAHSHRNTAWPLLTPSGKIILEYYLQDLPLAQSFQVEMPSLRVIGRYPSMRLIHFLRTDFTWPNVLHRWRGKCSGQDYCSTQPSHSTFLAASHLPPSWEVVSRVQYNIILSPGTVAWEVQGWRVYTECLDCYIIWPGNLFQWLPWTMSFVLPPQRKEQDGPKFLAKADKI